MRFSEAWLREWVDPAIDTQTLVDQLSMSGLEVDAVEPAAGAFSGVVVGQVLALEQHPNADKLRVCTVEVGGDEPLQIICGARNVAADMKVPVATVGAVLPGDFKIKKAKLRGVASFGMICSASELGLAESSDGILPLPADAPIGEDFRGFMALDDALIELDLTPDRGDCLSIQGVAREVGVMNRAEVRPPAIEPVAAVIDDEVEVRLDAADACPRYLGRIVRGIDPSAETPLWMCERLRRSGLRPINPVVDVTNYVLLELGQPMHGFDLAKLEGGIRVRMAAAGETLKLLSGDSIELRADSLVIADESRPLALAGIMGGDDSGVVDATRDVLLESAFFSPLAIAGKARGYSLHTDSSHRFERGVDPRGQRRAMERATRLLLDICGGEPGPIVEAAAEDQLAPAAPLLLRRARIRAVLGLDVDDATVADVLSRLGVELEVVDGGWRATPPSARFDLVQEVDLIAEIGRIYGYDRIPVTHARSAVTTPKRTESDFDLERAREILVARGFHEVITYSFVSPEMAEIMHPGGAVLRLSNPISADMSIMRSALWGGLATVARQNQARQQSRIRLFESGQCFTLVDGELEQRERLAGFAVGPAAPEQWGEQERPLDFYDLKADLEAVLTLSGYDGFRFESVQLDVLHPGQGARLLAGEREIGWIGMLHPSVADKLDLNGNAYAFEVDLEALNGGDIPAFEPLSKFPSIRRDLAIVLDDAVSFDRVESVVRAAEPELLKDLILFDVYRGDKIDSGRKSLALGLILQASSQTLTDEEVEAVIGRVLDRLESEVGARLRD